MLAVGLILLGNGCQAAELPGRMSDLILKPVGVVVMGWVLRECNLAFLQLFEVTRQHVLKIHDRGILNDRLVNTLRSRKPVNMYLFHPVLWLLIRREDLVLTVFSGDLAHQFVHTGRLRDGDLLAGPWLSPAQRRGVAMLTLENLLQ